MREKLVERVCQDFDYYRPWTASDTAKPSHVLIGRNEPEVFENAQLYRESMGQSGFYGGTSEILAFVEEFAIPVTVLWYRGKRLEIQRRYVNERNVKGDIQPKGDRIYFLFAGRISGGHFQPMLAPPLPRNLQPPLPKGRERMAPRGFFSIAGRAKLRQQNKKEKQKKEQEKQQEKKNGRAPPTHETSLPTLAEIASEIPPPTHETYLPTLAEIESEISPPKKKQKKQQDKQQEKKKGTATPTQKEKKQIT